MKNDWEELEEMRASVEHLLMEGLVMVDGFPKPNVRYLDFYRTFDIRPSVRTAVVQCFVKRYRNLQVQGVAAIGAGGFTLGALLANELGLPMYPVRKSTDTVYNAYRSKVDMVYAHRELTFSRDIGISGKPIVLVDDTISTGGTFSAAIDVLSQAGAEIVEIGAVFETISNSGRQRVHPIRVRTLVARDEF